MFEVSCSTTFTIYSCMFTSTLITRASFMRTFANTFSIFQSSSCSRRVAGANCLKSDKNKKNTQIISVETYFHIHHYHSWNTLKYIDYISCLHDLVCIDYISVQQNLANSCIVQIDHMSHQISTLHTRKLDIHTFQFYKILLHIGHNPIQCEDTHSHHTWSLWS